MRNPVLVAAGLLGLAAVLPFARVEGPVVVPLTVAIGGAVAIVWASLTRPRRRERVPPPENGPGEPAEDEPVRLHRAA